jgi:hypothetical protein
VALIDRFLNRDSDVDTFIAAYLTLWREDFELTSGMGNGSPALNNLFVDIDAYGDESESSAYSIGEEELRRCVHRAADALREELLDTST